MAEDDWMHRGQEAVLPPGTLFRRQQWTLRDADWDHDHCEFCWAKLYDPLASPQLDTRHRDDPEAFAEGFTTTEEHPHGAEYHWVCPPCFERLSARYGWRVESDE